MDPRRRHPHLLIDPSLPDPVSSALGAGPQALRAARLGEMPPARRPGPGTLFFTAALLMLVAALTGSVGLVSAVVLVILVNGLHRMISDPEGRRERRRILTAMEHTDRFILPEDLDAECGALLRRAQDAAETVLGSAVNRAHLLDSIDNAVTLPAQTWQLGRKLVRLSEMRAEYRRIVPDRPPSEVADAFAPYTGALKVAELSLTRRVEAMEEYARQVLKADGVYRAYGQLQALAEQTPQYEALIVETAEDALTVPDLARLGEHAQQVRRLFEQSIDEARGAARHLLTATDL
ncbi:hypothetical protein FHS43_004615 [Streptosporangium becharense]|uniref:Uncharacterized protein n=1 Tax=Streptosporangium becharense TaxID=1816182 RepID=A0A7W9IKA6_9ACTN|nr:hypothetical protein [Streptosporangium becharense]MBB2913317.1 hypothetical protein [Streptosporangium becharense]MBB5822300.1 hypothetical protein [Streptosporangium becharense]